MDDYAYTVKDNRVDCTDYKEFFETLEACGCIVLSKHAERDKRGKLHYHGVVKIPKICYRKTLCLKGLHLILKRVYDSHGWELYCKKDESDDDEDTNDMELLSKLTYKLFK